MTKSWQKRAHTNLILHFSSDQLAELPSQRPARKIVSITLLENVRTYIALDFVRASSLLLIASSRL